MERASLEAERMSHPKSSPPDVCRARYGRGDLGEPKVIFHSTSQEGVAPLLLCAYNSA